MAKAAKNEVLNNLSSMREQTMELITKSLLLDEGMENALRGHVRILESFRQRNSLKAREAMRHHLQSFQRGYNVLFEASSLSSQKKATPQAGKELRAPRTPQKERVLITPDLAQARKKK